MVSEWHSQVCPCPLLGSLILGLLCKCTWFHPFLIPIYILRANLVEAVLQIWHLSELDPSVSLHWFGLNPAMAPCSSCYFLPCHVIVDCSHWMKIIGLQIQMVRPLSNCTIEIEWFEWDWINGHTGRTREDSNMTQPIRTEEAVFTKLQFSKQLCQFANQHFGLVMPESEARFSINSSWHTMAEQFSEVDKLRAALLENAEILSDCPLVEEEPGRWAHTAPRPAVS